MSLPWFRMYAEAVDDAKLRLLAFEDRWHFVAILCCKCQGVLDTSPNTLDRRMAVKLGLQKHEIDELRKRLMDVGLINETWQPIAWANRQFQSDTDPTRAERQARYREKHMKRVSNALRNGRVTRVEQNRTDTEQSKGEKRATLPPGDFSLSDSLKTWVKKESIPEIIIPMEIEKFLDHHRKKGDKFVDWDAAFRTWLRNWKKWSREKRAPEDIFQGAI